MSDRYAKVVLLTVCLSAFSCGDASVPGIDFESELAILPANAWRGLDREVTHVLVSSVNQDESEAYFAQLAVRTLADAIYVYSFKTREFRKSELTPSLRETKWNVVRSAGGLYTDSFGLPAELLPKRGYRYKQIRSVLNQRAETWSRPWPPSRERWLVLSADGEHRVRRPSLWGPGGPTRFVYGQHYIQVISASTQEFVGRTIRVGFVTALDEIQIDWIDEEHMVIASNRYEWLAILHVDDFTRAEGANQPQSD